MTRKKAKDCCMDTLLAYRRRCILLERQVVRLLSSEPLKAQEAEIARLQERVIDLEDRWSECEGECYQLRALLGTGKTA